MFTRPIALSLSPNTELEDVQCALNVLLKPWLWKNGKDIKKIETWFTEKFGGGAVSFSSGRSAFYAILRAFGIDKGDEVVIQAFTCVAVAEPILWVGAVPVYVDVDETFNVDSAKLRSVISKRTKAIIVQHTFGTPADMDSIQRIAKEHNILVIEDCAHSLGAMYKGRNVGSFGNAAFFSFGRDKIISSVFGGMAIINSKFKVQNSKLKIIHEQLSYPGYFWILQQLLHPILFALILPLYNIGIGKLLLVILQKLHLLSFPIYKEEYSGGKPGMFPSRYPNALASLLLFQLGKLDRYNDRRRTIATTYYKKLSHVRSILMPSRVEGSIFLRFVVGSKYATRLLQQAKKQHILLGSWYKNVVDPKGVDVFSVGYKTGSCPNAEKYAQSVVNLPTYPRLTDEEVERVCKIVISNI